MFYPSKYLNKSGKVLPQYTKRLAQIEELVIQCRRNKTIIAETKEKVKHWLTKIT
jgi:hypothetical protein